MAKGKGKSSGGGSGLRKNHGPKRHMFKEYKPMVHLFAQAGVLDKYNNYESFCLACNARGKKNPSTKEFYEFSNLTRAQQDEYLKNLSK